MMRKIYWRVSPAATGPYKSFQNRSWPTGWNDRKESHAIAHIIGQEDYAPRRVKAGDYKPLRVAMAIKKEESFVWCRLKAEFKTIDEAKAAAAAFYNAHPEMFRGT